MNKKKLVPLALALPLSVAAALPASAAQQQPSPAQQGGVLLTTNLSSLNGSGAVGTASVTIRGNTVDVDIDTSNLVAGAPHAQHFHVGGRNVCPSPGAAGEDGIISTAEGQPAYGGIKASLTTQGDTSPDSALAVDRMPVAGENGWVMYDRTFQVSPSLAQSIRAGEAVIVQHGIDTNGNGQYDNSAGPSSVDPSLPLEAVAPAACGELPGVSNAGGNPDGNQGGNQGQNEDEDDEGLLGLGLLIL